jgi:hypothetical protein
MIREMVISKQIDSSPSEAGAKQVRSKEGGKWIIADLNQLNNWAVKEQRADASSYI